MISIMIISTRARFNLLRDTAVDNRAPKSQEGVIIHE